MIRLTQREASVLQLIADGKSNKEIALGFGISIKTVEKHRQHIFHKFGPGKPQNAAGVCVRALRMGLIR